jgi:hydroxyacylglutathione hydrolase
MIHLERFVFNPLEENTYVLFDDTKECVVIDPGCYEKQEQQELVEFISSAGLTVVSVLNTHCHVDHVLGNAFVKNHFRAPLLIPKHEEQVLRAVKSYASNYGFFQYQEAEPDGFLSEEHPVSFGAHQLQVLFVPGHSPGHLAFYHADSKMIIGGDVLFENSIGRTDLPGGNYDTLIHSIHTKFFTLPDDVIVYCGHGSETSIGFEKRTNPFCALT